MNNKRKNICDGVYDSVDDMIREYKKNHEGNDEVHVHRKNGRRKIRRSNDIEC